MTDERAAEILNPEHREHYDSLETVNEACRIGMNAIKELSQLQEELSRKGYVAITEILDFLKSLKVPEDGRHIWRDHHNDCIDKCKHAIKQKYGVTNDTI